MEATLRMIAKYWRRPLQGRVVCFVAHDLSNWSDESLRHSQARVLLEHVRGGTQILERDGRSTKSSAHVYATSNRGVAEHELVHAYCHLTFGTCGPEWYKEGMADVAARSGRGGGAVNCPPEVVRLLRQERGKSIRDIVIARRFTEPIADRMDEIHEAQSTGDLAKNQWLAADDEIVAKARQSYDWSWSLCHFLCNNPNYRDRFRMLGMGYLSQSDVSFQQLFGPVADQLIFEYDLFLRDVDNG
jgi:hypothetical protein